MVLVGLTSESERGSSVEGAGGGGWDGRKREVDDPCH